MIRLAQPYLLILGGLFLLPYLWRPRRAWQYSSLQLLPAKTHIGVGALVTAGMTTAAIGFLLIALARPQRPLQHTRRLVMARDTILTLDLSLSMEDSIPSAAGNPPFLRKLDLVQQAALAFVQRHPHDRLGLIVFGDEAFGAWPLSTDSSTLQKRLQHLDGLLPTTLRGTQVERALTTSLDHMHQLGQAQTKLIVMLTDGLDTLDPEGENRLIRRLRQLGVKLYILGIQLPKDSSLVHLINQAQGQYYDISQAADLEQAFQDIDRLEPSQITLTRTSAYKDLYPMFAVLGLVGLLGSALCKAVWVFEG